MHELAVTQSILETVLEQAGRHGASRVVRVRLVKGELTDYVDETLQWLFETLAADTPAAGAEVVVQHRPIRFVCHACGNAYDVSREQFVVACPRCGATDVEMTGGREFLLESIEIE